MQNVELKLKGFPDKQKESALCFYREQLEKNPQEFEASLLKKYRSPMGCASNIVGEYVVQEKEKARELPLNLLFWSVFFMPIKTIATFFFVVSVFTFSILTAFLSLFLIAFGFALALFGTLLLINGFALSNFANIIFYFGFSTVVFLVSWLFVEGSIKLIKAFIASLKTLCIKLLESGFK